MGLCLSPWSRCTLRLRSLLLLVPRWVIVSLGPERRPTALVSGTTSSRMADWLCKIVVVEVPLAEFASTSFLQVWLLVSKVLVVRMWLRICRHRVHLLPLLLKVTVLLLVRWPRSTVIRVDGLRWNWRRPTKLTCLLMLRTSLKIA